MQKGNPSVWISLIPEEGDFTISFDFDSLCSCFHSVADTEPHPCCLSFAERYGASKR